MFLLISIIYYLKNYFQKDLIEKKNEACEIYYYQIENFMLINF